MASDNDKREKLDFFEAFKLAIATLTPREREVLRERFLAPIEGRQKDQMNFDVTRRERIRLIEAKAMRKLRHPSRSKWLKQWLEGGDEPKKQK